MDSHKLILEQERVVIGQLVRNIVQSEAPQELDILDTIEDEFYAVAGALRSDQRPNERAFSFSGTDFQAFLATALLYVTTFVVMPFLKKACEEAIEKTSEKSVESLAKGIRAVLDRLKKKDKKPPSSTDQIDILVPINWVDFVRQIKSEGRQIGLSRSDANELADLTVRELSENQVMLANMLLTVLRVPVGDEASKKR
jgi:hypothetical protein